MVRENLWKGAKKMDKERKKGEQKLNLSYPNFLERFLNLCILFALLDFFLHFYFLFSHGVTSTCVCVGESM